VELVEVLGATDVCHVGRLDVTTYWLTPTFHGLNIGLTRLALGEYSDAAEHLQAGFDGLPDSQQEAEWTTEYRRALDEARAAR
jgi:hypothetical protein